MSQEPFCHTLEDLEDLEAAALAHLRYMYVIEVAFVMFEAAKNDVQGEYGLYNKEQVFIKTGTLEGMFGWSLVPAVQAYSGSSGSLTDQGDGDELPDGQVQCDLE